MLNSTKQRNFHINLCIRSRLARPKSLLWVFDLANLDLSDSSLSRSHPYFWTGLFAGLLSADFWGVKNQKSSHISVAMGMLNFDLKFAQRCKNMYLGTTLFFWSTGFQLMADWVIFHFDGWLIKHVFTPWRVGDRASMSLMICRGNMRLSKSTIQIFWQLTALWKSWCQSQNFLGGLVDSVCVYIMKGWW